MIKKISSQTSVYKVRFGLGAKHVKKGESGFGRGDGYWARPRRRIRIIQMMGEYSKNVQIRK